MRKFFYPTSTGLVPMTVAEDATRARMLLVACPPFDPFTDALPRAADVDGIVCDHPVVAARCALAGLVIAAYDPRAGVFHMYSQDFPEKTWSHSVNGEYPKTYDPHECVNDTEDD